MRRSRAVLLGLVLALGCGRDAPEGGTSGGTANAGGGGAPPPPPTPSHFDVPLEYDFTPVLETVERAVPRTFGSLDDVRTIRGDERRRYAYVATRGPFTTFMRDTLVHLRARLAYAARGWYEPPIGPTLSAGCGDRGQRPLIDVELVTPLTLDSTWHLRSRARLARLVPARGSHCQVSLVRIDVTDRVLGAARLALESQMPHIDRMVGRIDLSGRAAGWWTALERPIRLRDDVWLELRPQRLRLGRVAGAGRVMHVEAGLDALPRIVVGASPPVAHTPLPPLGRDTTAGGFRIIVDGEVDWATASREIADTLRGRTITRLGRTVRITSAAVGPTRDGRVALTVGFAGDADGRLRLVGRPQLDATRTAVVVPDLDYDVATGDGLVRVVDWLMDDELRDMLRERARVPVAPVLARGRTLLEQGLNRTIGKVMALSARVDSVAVDGIFVTTNGLLVRAGATGAARVVVQ
ncbi:MAG TPA: DUF4403 family protein [Gemmatimonadaceae bacterium]|nr:DUF4403 family protein [Gemmatimonadaceae bacterium]